MNNTNYVRDTILQKLRLNDSFNGMVTAEINGFNFSAADIAILGNDGRSEVYRISVIKYL